MRRARRSDASAARCAPGWALTLTAVLCVAELVGGWLTNSLALLTDAAHMLTDVGALALTLFALWVGRAAARARSKTFGYVARRSSPRCVNGVVLCVAGGLHPVGGVDAACRRRRRCAREACWSSRSPASLVNIFVRLAACTSTSSSSLNLRGAYLHVLSDLLGSIGAIVARAWSS